MASSTSGNGNLVDEFEEAFQACVHALTKQESSTGIDKSEIGLEVDQTTLKFIDLARQMEAFFIQKRFLLSALRPELVLKEENLDLRMEISRKDELIKKHYERIENWKMMLAENQQGHAMAQNIPPPGATGALHCGPMMGGPGDMRGMPMGAMGGMGGMAGMSNMGNMGVMNLPPGVNPQGPMGGPIGGPIGGSIGGPIGGPMGGMPNAMQAQLQAQHMQQQHLMQAQQMQHMQQMQVGPQQMFMQQGGVPMGPRSGPAVGFNPGPNVLQGPLAYLEKTTSNIDLVGMADGRR